MIASVLQKLNTEMPNIEVKEEYFDSEVCGEINRIFKSNYSPLCLRIRENESRFAYEHGLVKEALVGLFLSSGPTFDGATLIQHIINHLENEKTGSSINNPLGPTIHFYDHSYETIPYCWSAQTWIDGVPIDRAPAGEAYHKLGDKIATLHATKFQKYPPNFREGWLTISSWHEVRKMEMLRILKENQLEIKGLLNLIISLNPKIDELVLTHNDLQPLNLIWSNNDIWLIDWDNAQIAPKELDFVKLRYWTARDSDGFLSFDENRYSEVLASYQHATGETLAHDIFLFCEVLWLLRVWNFEKKREDTGAPTPKPYKSSAYYHQRLTELASN